MAAKQGLSAQISQASEDAKRAVLNRTSLTTSLWFSNLNTTCTIKSAPPRTPEVLSLLSTKSGWLFKRNEQHVWQTRWCCVVPHTFLYYFDANVLPGEAQPPVPPAALQEDWNQAVANGYPHRGGRRQQAPRSTLYLFPGGGGGGGTTTTTNTSSTHDDDHHHNHPYGSSSSHSNYHHHSQSNSQINHHHSHSVGGGMMNGENNPYSPTGSVPHHPNGITQSSEFFASMQPAGIIDLECYTAVHRSAQNQLVLELAGDDAVNPDLRQFYFTAGSEQETEDWTQALLGQRHTALMDETEAYKQVCDGFAQQLQVLHVEMDRAQKQAEDAQEELYQVRSEMEDGRRSCWKLVEEVLDRHQSAASTSATGENDGNNNNATNPAAGQGFRAELDAIRSQDMSLLAPVQLLSDYTQVLEDSCNELQAHNKSLQETLAKANDSDHDQVQKLQKELEDTKALLAQQQSQWNHDKQVLQQKLDRSTKELEDLNKDLASTRMEITMYQSSTRNKIVELHNHKKILKKEVLDLRQKLEDAQSELSLVRHKEKSYRLEVDQERKKAELLERYVDKMESQVKVQQNMMEMMSSSGVGSIHGGMVVNGNGSNTTSHYEVTVPHTVHSPQSATSYQSTSRRNLLLAGNNDDQQNNVVGDDAAVPGIQMPTINNDGNNNNNGNDDNEDDNNLVVGHHHHHSLPSPLLRRGMLQNDDDNKSHMSELTEDRTQKQFDALHYLREARERELEDGRPSSAVLSNARLLRYASAAASPSPTQLSSRCPTPPTYILGGGDNNNNNATTTGNNNNSARYSNPLQQQHQQKLLQQFQNPESAKLDTIHSSATAMTTPPRLLTPGPEHLPRSNRTSQQPPHQVVVDNNNGGGKSSTQSLGAGTPGRLSVAQRARLQADRGSTPIKIRLCQDNSNNNNDRPVLLQQQQQHKQTHLSSASITSTPPATSPPRNKARMERRPSNSSRSTTGGFFSALGRKLEEAIDKSVFSVDVHVNQNNHPDDEEDLSSSGGGSGNVNDDNGSFRGRDPAEPPHVECPDNSSSSRKPALLTQETLDGHNNNSSTTSTTSPTNKAKVVSPKNSFGTPRRYDSSSSLMSEEKKVPERTKSLTLQERQALQRAKQLQFLKDQGLIKDEADIKGGAAGSAAATSFDTSSVTSTNISGHAGSISLPGTPRRWHSSIG